MHDASNLNFTPSIPQNLSSPLSLFSISHESEISHHLHYVVDSTGNFDSKASVLTDSAMDAYSKLRIRNQPHPCHHLLSIEKSNPSSTASPPG